MESTKEIQSSLKKKVLSIELKMSSFQVPKNFPPYYSKGLYSLHLEQPSKNRIPKHLTYIFNTKLSEFQEVF